MKTKLTIIYICALLFSVSAFAQSGSLKGNVTSGVDAVVGATVVLYNAQGGIVKGAATDADGKYELTNISSGSYLLEVKSIGYGDITQNVTIVDGENTMDFSMEESMNTLSAVTISGGRRAQRRTETSTNIQIVSAEVIKVAKEPTAYGLLKGVNGIDYVETGLGQQQVNARGFASPFTGGLLTLVDYRSVTLPGIGGVFGPAMGVNQNDIKQIEVIVGPNSALYGAGAANGVVNIITKNPKEYAGHEVMVRGGTQNQLAISARSSAMLGDKFGYKISGEYFTAEDFDQTQQIITGGQETGIFTNPDNTIKNTTVSGALYFFPTDNTEISYTSGISIANYVNQSNIGSLQIKDFTFWYHQLRANFNNFLGGSAFFQANYTADDAKNTYDLEDVARAVAGGMDEATAIAAATFVDKPSRLTGEFQHNFNFAEDNIVTWGAQYTNTQPNSEGTFLSDGPTGNLIVINEMGAYLQYENEMVENFNLTLSGRYDHNDVFGGRFSPKVSLAYKPNNHNFRIAYNEAFVSPPIQPAFAQTEIARLQTPGPAGTPIAGLPSDPVELVLRGAGSTGFKIIDASGAEIGAINNLVPTVHKSFEVGYKGLIANKLFIDFTYFNTTITNFLSAPTPINNPELIFGSGLIPTGIGWADLVFTGAPQGSPITYVEGYPAELVLTYFNYGKVNTNGINVGIEYLLTNTLSINAGFQAIKLGNFEEVPDFVDFPAILNAPELTARAGIRYTNTSGVFAELTYRWSEAHQFIGAMEYQRGIVPTYTVFDLKGEMPIKSVNGLAVGIIANNLFDHKYRALPGTPLLGFMGSAYVRFEFGK